MTSKDIDKKNKYLDSVAMFLVKYVPDYTELPEDSKNALEHIWIALADNRVEFMRVLDNVKPTRKRENNMEYKSDPACRIYVGNLGYGLDEDDVRDMFNVVGLVRDVYLPRVYGTPKRKGYGFIELSSPEDAKAAIDSFNGQMDASGRLLIVRMADDRLSKEDLAARRRQ